MRDEMEAVFAAIGEVWVLPDFLTVIMVGAFPVTELRGAIPLAVAGYGFSPSSAFALSVVGNALVPFVLLPILGRVSTELSKRFFAWERFFAWLFRWTRQNHEKNFKRWKELLLVILVAIPLPLTGAWTACLVAFVFGIPFRKAIPLIVLGILLAGVVVTATTVGIIKF